MKGSMVMARIASGKKVLAQAKDLLVYRFTKIDTLCGKIEVAPPIDYWCSIHLCNAFHNSVL